jgi:hypothetical protein
MLAHYSVVVGGLAHDRDGRLEALLVGTPNGSSLDYVGRVEFGLNRLGDMRERFDALTSTHAPFSGEAFKSSEYGCALGWK